MGGSREPALGAPLVSSGEQYSSDAGLRDGARRAGAAGGGAGTQRSSGTAGTRGRRAAVCWAAAAGGLVLIATLAGVLAYAVPRARGGGGGGAPDLAALSMAAAIAGGSSGGAAAGGGALGGNYCLGLPEPGQRYCLDYHTSPGKRRFAEARDWERMEPLTCERCCCSRGRAGLPGAPALRGSRFCRAPPGAGRAPRPVDPCAPPRPAPYAAPHSTNHLAPKHLTPPPPTRPPPETLAVRCSGLTPDCIMLDLERGREGASACKPLPSGARCYAGTVCDKGLCGGGLSSLKLARSAGRGWRIRRAAARLAFLSHAPRARRLPGIRACALCVW